MRHATDRSAFREEEHLGAVGGDAVGRDPLGALWQRHDPAQATQVRCRDPEPLPPRPGVIPAPEGDQGAVRGRCMRARCETQGPGGWHDDRSIGLAVFHRRECECPPLGLALRPDRLAVRSDLETTAALDREEVALPGAVRSDREVMLRGGKLAASKRDRAREVQGCRRCADGARSLGWRDNDRGNGR